MKTDLPKETQRKVGAVAKALSVLDCFSLEAPELTMTELSEKTHIPKSGIMRICGTLVMMGYLTRDPVNAHYRLGPRLLLLGKIYEKTNTLASLARPILRELTAQTGESSFLFVVEDMKRLCLARDEGTQAIRFAFLEGQSVELAGASGKILLAYSPPEFRERVLAERALGRYHPTTRKQREDLKREYQKIIQQGYAVSQGDMLSEAGALGAPVFNHDNQVCATITVAGPIQRFQPENHPKLLKYLLDAAQRLSTQMGYTTRKSSDA